MADDVFGHRSLVETIAALLGDLAQGLRQPRIAHLLAGLRGAAARKQHRIDIGLRRKAFGAFRPVEGDAVGDDVAFLGIADRRGQQLVERLAAVIGVDPAPGIDQAGIGHGVDAIGRHRIEALGLIPIDDRPLRCTARAVIGDDLAAALRRIEQEPVAADAGRLRLDHREDGGGGDRRIDRVAAGLQRLDRRRARQRMRGGSRRFGDAERRSAGKLEITHDEATFAFY